MHVQRYNQNELNVEVASVNIKEGDLLLSQLIYHTCWKKFNEERIVISFNVDVK